MPLRVLLLIALLKSLGATSVPDGVVAGVLFSQFSVNQTEVHIDVSSMIEVEGSKLSWDIYYKDNVGVNGCM